MKWNYMHMKKLLTIRTLRIVIISSGIPMLIFLETFGNTLEKIEGVPELVLLYFVTFIFTVLHWIFLSIKSILKLKQEKANTELQHLQSQVNPHFFFNMLNNLYGLVDKDSDKAKALILKLSEMMRYSIYEGLKDAVTLQQEIDFISNFIELHTMRYHKDIDVQFDVAVANKTLNITPLLFIILIENAFKHGVEVLRKNAFVHISMATNTNRVTLTIENNFDTEMMRESGIGLENLKRRLQLVYPKKHTLENSINTNIYSTKLTIHL